MSKDKLPKLARMGHKVVAYLDEVKETDTETGESYFYHKAVIDSFNRPDIIESLVRSKYPTYGAELASINNGGEDFSNYEAWRTFSKAFAYEVETFYTSGELSLETE
ncbi:MAG: hypothetical protein EOM67_14305 [Spirochaetia bacterium]|nr:hypothetical protein [Spirochaetia bacterium]